MAVKKHGAGAYAKHAHKPQCVDCGFVRRLRTAGGGCTPDTITCTNSSLKSHGPSSHCNDWKWKVKEGVARCFSSGLTLWPGGAVLPRC